MAFVMKLIGLRAGGFTPHDGRYLREYDPSKPPGLPEAEQHPGDCWLVTTPNIAEAQRFPSAVEGWAAWKRVDSRRPLRADGQPNRPLTAYTVMFLPAEPVSPEAEEARLTVEEAVRIVSKAGWR